MLCFFCGIPKAISFAVKCDVHINYIYLAYKLSIERYKEKGEFRTTIRSRAAEENREDEESNEK